MTATDLFFAPFFRRALGTVATALVMCTALPALAQQADSAAGADAGNAEASDPASDPAGLGQPYLLELSGDWQIICVRTELEHDPCSMGQDLTDQGDSQVAQVRILSLPPGSPTAAAVNVSTPLATLLSRDVTLSVDGGPPRSYGFTYCTQSFCLASFGLTEEEVNAMRRGAVAEWTIYALQAPDTPVTLRSSLSGFTAGFQRIAELNTLNARAAQAAQAAQGNQ